MRAAAAAVVLALTSACGSTVAVSHTAQGAQGLGGDGLTAPSQSAQGTTPLPGASTAQGGPGSGTPGAVAGQPSAGATLPGRPAVSVPSTTPITVGFVVEDNTAALAKGFGTDNLQNGNERAMAEALVADVNARGGIHGRTLKAVFFAFNGSTDSDFTTLQQNACATFSEDNHAFAVLLGWHAFADHALETCLERRGIIAINSAGILTGGASMFRQLQDVVAPPGLTLERQARTYVDAVGHQGFFGSGTKVGVIALDNGEYRSAVASDLLPTLKRWGVGNPDVFYYPPLAQSADISRQSAAMSNAVLKFNSEGVNRVLFLQQGINGPFLFMRAANPQHYHPRYALSSTDAPAALAPNVPAEQLAGSVGLGWLPVDDVLAAQETQSAPRRKACLDLLKKKTGETFATRTVEYVGLSFCDSVWFFEHTADLTRALDRASFHAAVATVGTGYASPLVLRSDFTSVRRDGAAAGRDLHFDGRCSCFAYYGSTRTLT